MSRVVYSFLFAFCVSLFSFSTVGCGPKNEVIVDTRSEAELQKEEEEYEKMMSESSDDVSQ